jgi:hypothetical protein
MAMKRIESILFFFMFVIVFSAGNGESFDSQTILNVSNNIAERQVVSDTSKQTQVEQTLDMANSSRSTVERGNANGIGITTGLSAYIGEDQIPNNPALNDMRDKLNWAYEGQISIKQSNNIPREGMFVPDPITRSGTIYVRPDVLTSDKTDLGRVLYHEMEHARNYIWEAKFGMPSHGVIEEIYSDAYFRQTVAFQKVGPGKAEWIPLSEWRVMDAENNFSRANPHSTYKNSEAAAMRNIEIGSPPVFNTTRLPPPNILFSAPKVPTSSSDRTSTYTPPLTYTPMLPPDSPLRKK